MLPMPSAPWTSRASRCGRSSGAASPRYTGTVAPHSSSVVRALRVACATSTLPATVLMPSTCTPGVRSAMTNATASSEAVSVSMNRRGMSRGAMPMPVSSTSSRNRSAPSRDARMATAPPFAVNFNAFDA